MKTQDLLDMARMLDDLPKIEFSMERWHLPRPCGFAACAVGWWCIKHPSDALKLVPRRMGAYPAMADTVGIDAVAERFDISLRGAVFLFAAGSLGCRRCKRLNPDLGVSVWCGCVCDSPKLSRELEAPRTVARRIRRFVYFKLKQAEMGDKWEEPEYGAVLELVATE